MLLLLYHPSFTFRIFMDTIKILIDQDCVDRYNAIYFEEHPRANKVYIKRPQHPSINVYTTMHNQAQNKLKHYWNDFIVWRLSELGLCNKQISKCSMIYKTYFYENRRHDLDNISPKFIFDGFVAAGMLTDDNSEVIQSLTLECGIDKENPRMEFEITIL